jgi:hypothetical protein
MKVEVVNHRLVKVQLTDTECLLTKIGVIKLKNLLLRAISEIEEYEYRKFLYDHQGQLGFVKEGGENHV